MQEYPQQVNTGAYMACFTYSHHTEESSDHSDIYVILRDWHMWDKILAWSPNYNDYRKRNFQSELCLSIYNYAHTYIHT